MKHWEEDRAHDTKLRHAKFHQIEWTNGETMDWFRWLFEFAGLPQLEGHGRCPPVLGPQTRWVIEHVKKYLEPEKDGGTDGQDWEILHAHDSLHFI